MTTSAMIEPRPAATLSPAALAPCPFCTGEAAFGTTDYNWKKVQENGWEQSVFHQVNCISCGATNRGLVGHRTQEAAADHWNCRSALSTPEPVSVLEGWQMVPDVASADEIVTRLYRRFKDWAKRGFGPDDVTWCEVKADVLAMLAAAPPPPVSAAPVSGEVVPFTDTKSMLRHFGQEEYREGSRADYVTASEWEDYVEVETRTLERIRAALSPSPEGVNAVEVARKAAADLSPTDRRRIERVMSGKWDDLQTVRGAIVGARAILSHLGIPDLSKEGGKS